MLKYIKEKRGIKLTLSVDNMSVIKWWIYASYVMHEDCQVHTWSRISLGKRVMSSFSTKQTMKLKSSTEIDPVGIDDVMKNTMVKILHIGTGVYYCT